MNPVVMTVTLVTEDGVLIDAVHLPARSFAGAARPDGGELIAPPVPAEQRDLAIVVAHGFTMSWQRPLTWNLLRRFNEHAGVVTFDFRGHGRSGGLSTLGDKEINDLDVAVRYARELGYRRVVTVGFSMGGSVVLRHAALYGGVDAVISVSGPGRWFYRGTVAMRRVHLAAEKRLGRAFTKYMLNTRISPEGWPTPDPLPPAAAAARVAPVPLLIVHGDADIYFPPDHGKQLYEAAGDPKELWLLPGFGHAERHTDDALVDRIAAWADTAAAAYQATGTPIRTERRSAGRRAQEQQPATLAQPRHPAAKDPAVGPANPTAPANPAGPANPAVGLRPAPRPAPEPGPGNTTNPTSPTGPAAVNSPHRWVWHRYGYKRMGAAPIRLQAPIARAIGGCGLTPPPFLMIPNGFGVLRPRSPARRDRHALGVA